LWACGEVWHGGIRATSDSHFHFLGLRTRVGSTGSRPSVSSHLLWIVDNNLGHSLVLRYLPRDAEPLPLVVSLGRPELAPVLALDQHREDLIRVRFVQIEERRLSLVDAAYRVLTTLPQTVAVSPM
jgi:hypothetical protein